MTADVDKAISNYTKKHPGTKAFVSRDSAVVVSSKDNDETLLVMSAELFKARYGD